MQIEEFLHGQTLEIGSPIGFHADYGAGACLLQHRGVRAFQWSQLKNGRSADAFSKVFDEPADSGIVKEVRPASAGHSGDGKFRCPVTFEQVDYTLCAWSVVGKNRWERFSSPKGAECVFQGSFRFVEHCLPADMRRCRHGWLGRTWWIDQSRTKLV